MRAKLTDQNKIITMPDDERSRMINGLITIWEEDTILSSSPCQDHPAFTIITKMGKQEWCTDIVITTVLKRMQKGVTLFFGVLYDIVPEKDQPKIPDDIKGMMQKQTDIWLQWGKRKGYID